MVRSLDPSPGQQPPGRPAALIADTLRTTVWLGTSHFFLGVSFILPVLLLKLEFSYACAEFPLLRMSEEGLFRTDTKQHLSVVA